MNQRNKISQKTCLGIIVFLFFFVIIVPNQSYRMIPTIVYRLRHGRSAGAVRIIESKLYASYDYNNFYSTDSSVPSPNDGKYQNSRQNNRPLYNNGGNYKGSQPQQQGKMEGTTSTNSFNSKYSQRSGGNSFQAKQLHHPTESQIDQSQQQEQQEHVVQTRSEIPSRYDLCLSLISGVVGVDPKEQYLSNGHYRLSFSVSSLLRQPC
jgi:hypothetical protein